MEIQQRSNFKGAEPIHFLLHLFLSQNNSWSSEYELDELLDILFMGLVSYRVQVSRSPIRY
jgi:hypothetical protein